MTEPPELTPLRRTILAAMAAAEGDVYGADVVRITGLKVQQV